MKMKSPVAAIADKHICLAFTAVTKAAGQVAWTALRGRRDGSSHNLDKWVKGRCTGTAVAKAIELAPTSNAAHATACGTELANGTDEGCGQILVDRIAQEG